MEIKMLPQHGVYLLMQQRDNGFHISVLLSFPLDGPTSLRARVETPKLYAQLISRDPKRHGHKAYSCRPRRHPALKSLNFPSFSFAASCPLKTLAVVGLQPFHTKFRIPARGRQSP